MDTKMKINPPIFLSIVIPVYNEENTIQKVVNDHLEILIKNKQKLADWEIVCLDDASTDQSLQILNELSKKHTEIRIVCHKKNEGIYASFNDLFQSSQGSHIYVTAADDQWPAQNLEILLQKLLKTSSDLVIGVRNNRREIYSLWRRILSTAFNKLPQLLFNVKTEDANGIKLGRREIFIFPLISNSFFAEIERIILAKQKGYKVDFAPIEFHSRTKGKEKGAKWSNILATLKDLIRYTITRF